MDTSWSIFSGGRLNQIPVNSIFRITTDDRFESILFRSALVKQSFEDKLKRQLPLQKVNASSQVPLCIMYQSVVVGRESTEQEVELSVVVKDETDDSMLWHFILMSPERHISPDDLDEIVTLIINRLFPDKMHLHKACL
jgi:hypothetical protein